MSEQPEIIDEGSPTANMYGCQPCPKCEGKYRFPLRIDGVVKIQCDDCGYTAQCVRSDGQGWLGDPEPDTTEGSDRP